MDSTMQTRADDQRRSIEIADKARHYQQCRHNQMAQRHALKRLPQISGALILPLVLISHLVAFCPAPAQSAALFLNPLEISGQRDPDDAPIALLLDGIATLEDSTSRSPLTSSLSSIIGNDIERDNQSSAVGQLSELSEESATADKVLLVSNIIASSIIFVIGFIGNAVVILVILKFTRVQTVTDIYILNLAVADMMFLAGLVFLVTTFMLGTWIFGNIMCKVYMGLTSLNQFASSLLLVVMSFDRFLAVCHPIYAQRFRRLRRAKIICLCIWFICLILMTPILTFAKIGGKDLTCTIFWPDHYCEMAYTLYSFSIGFAAPLMLIAVFYICVIRKLRSAASGTSLGSARRSRSRESTNRRVEHLVIGIICTYTVCWLPYWITQLTVSFAQNTELSPLANHWWFVLLGSSLSYTNSALNPILYAFLSGNFIRRCNDIVNSIYSIKWLGGASRSRSGNANSNSNNNNNQPPASTTNCFESETVMPILPTAKQRLAANNNEQTSRLILSSSPHQTDDDNDDGCRLRTVELDEMVTMSTACDHSEQQLEDQHHQLPSVISNSGNCGEQTRKKSVAFSADTVKVVASVASSRAATTTTTTKQDESNNSKSVNLLNHKTIKHCDIIMTCQDV